MFLIVYYLIVSALAVVCTQGTNPTDCTANMCEMVGETEICKQCNQGKVPINGGCATADDVKAKCTKANGTDKADRTCEKCLGTTFMYKGGCYDIGQAPGSLICETAGSTGVCNACKAGFFKSTSAAENKQSCIACNETETIDTFTGVPKCRVCNPPGSSATTAECTTCEDGFFGATCKACSDDNCATCAAEGTGKCSKCKATGEKLYLKKEGSGTGTCVSAAECTAAGSYFPDSTSDPKECKACEATCATCAGAGASQCTSCNPDKPYLKKTDSLQTGTCVNAADCTNGNTYYADDTVDPTSGKLCRKCAEGGVTVCTKCEKIESGVVCKECPGPDNTIFGLGRKSCVKDCPADSSPDTDSVCVQQ